ncbi:MAG: class I tRNA ligase family protein [Candidatus Doudnabacteria bacterium]|nr:class I tRNA ligase family protein [Candidatus Doudnabacteria bacterium]
MKEFSKTYDHTKVEGTIYDKWLKSGYFTPENLPRAESRKPYTIIMPPPNANAPSHVGHALGYTIQDILIRFERMRGRKTLWLPGTDHAGFETQVVFEKKLEKEGRSRFKMQREEFYKEIWKYVQENKYISEEAIKRLGASCDWSRNIFTLDPEIVKIVYQTFGQMYKDGLAYRAGRICNWCPKHQTGLSDLETKYEERTEPFYYFKYGPFTIGTSRPETKFGDKYVVMHPKDKRYAKFKSGQKLDLEWINGPITATVVKDEAVDVAFGSGVMTITPAHDPVDFEIAQRHGLEIETIIDKRGRLLPIAGEFAGQKILETRPKIVEKLEKKGLLEKIEEKYKHNVQLCYKCGNLIEPQIVMQWYIKMTEKLPDGRPSLRAMALEALDKKEVEIVTEKFEKIFRHWMENIRDWPISRQIWWGIPIPVWYCGGAEKASGPKMGFAGHIAPEVSNGKIRTYRLRNHNLKTGDRVAFENSQSKLLFGYGVMTTADKKPVGDIQLPDALHGGKYNTTKELIAAFERLHPDRKVTKDTPAWLYTYQFKPFSEQDKKEGCGQIIISSENPKTCPACGGVNLIQDPDTFDTWFSSGQWPFAALMANDAKSNLTLPLLNKERKGEADFQTYYPTQVMETGWDILFFWVARMIMLSYYKTGYKTGKPPFKKVLLHGLVRARDRQKMSKSKGNVTDPLGVIDTYGTDALRFALVFSTAAGNDIPLSEDKIRGMKHFANKLWNIARYVLTNVSIPNSQFPVPKREAKSLPHTVPNALVWGYKLKTITAADREISKKLQATVASVTKNLENFRLHEAAQAIYQFSWHEFADKYIEESKKQLKDEKTKKNTLYTLYFVLTTILKLLHPFMPFVTEEIWSKLDQKEMLMISPWPK